MPYLTTTHIRLLVVAAVALAVAVVAALMAADLVAVHASVNDGVSSWAGRRHP